MKKIAFLDRDGVINHEPGHYTRFVEEFVINDGIGESVKLLKESGYTVIIISNQGGIAKGLYSADEVLNMHKKLQDYLLEYKTEIDDFYFCPHHNDFGKCLCRKPGNLLFEKAIYLYNANPQESFIIGDSERDLKAAEKSGVKGFLITPNDNIFELCREIAKI